MDAVVTGVLGKMFGKHPMRVTNKFSFFMPFQVQGSYQSAWGMSFQIEDWDWKRVGPDWERFSHRPFPPEALSPVCDEYAVGGETTSFSETMGFKNPTIRATCSACKQKLLFDLGRGQFMPVGRG